MPTINMPTSTSKNTPSSTISGRRGAEEQSVLHDQESDHLTDRFLPRNHREEADQHDGQGDRQGALAELESHWNDGLRDENRQHDQPAANQETSRHVDIHHQLARHVQPLDDLFQNPRDHEDLDDDGQPRRDINVMDAGEEGHERRRGREEGGLQREQVHAGRQPPLRDDREAGQ